MAINCPPNLATFKIYRLESDADGNNSPSPGDTLAYTVAIANWGCAPATGVVFSDTVDGNTRLVAGSVQTNQGTVSAGNQPGDTRVVVNVGSVVATNSDVVIGFRVTINNPLPSGVREVSNQGVASSNELADVLTDNPATEGVYDPTITPVTAAPIIVATKQARLFADNDHNGLVTRGDELLYTISITNEGNMDAAGIVFDDTPDVNTRLLTGTVATTRGTVTRGNGSADTGVSVDVGDLPGSQSNATITFRVLINPAMVSSASQVINQGVVSGAQLTTPVPTDDPETPLPGTPTIVDVEDPGALKGVKSGSLYADNDSDGDISPGDTLRYTIRIRNTGTAVISDTIFTDSPDPKTSLMVGSVQTSQGTVTVGNQPGDMWVAIDIGAMWPGIANSVTVNFLAVIANPFPPEEPLVLNQGVITSSVGVTVTYSVDETNPTPGPTPVIVIVRPRLNINLLAPACVLPGASFNVTWTLANTGNGALMGGTLTSTVTGSGSGSGIQAIGVVPGQGTYTVTQAITASQPVEYGAEVITVTGQIMTATQTAEVPVCAPDFRASSASVAAMPQFAAEGFTYTWHLRNTGNAGAAGVDAVFTPTNVPLYSFVRILSVSSGDAAWDPFLRHVTWHGDLPAGQDVTVEFISESIFGLPSINLVSPFEVAHPWRPTFHGESSYKYPYKLFFMLVLKDANVSP